MSEILPEPDLFSVSCSLLMILTPVLMPLLFLFWLEVSTSKPFCLMWDTGSQSFGFKVPKASSKFPLYKMILLPGPFAHHSFPFWSWECSIFFHPYVSSHKLWSPAPGLSFTIRPWKAYSWPIQKCYFLQARWQFGGGFNLLPQSRMSGSSYE